MGTGLILIAVGLGLVVVEFFVPGGILGAAGAIVLIVGLVFFAIASPSLWLTLVVIILSVVLLGLLVKFALYRISHTKQEASIYLKADQEGYHAPTYAKELIGQEGVVDSDLKPAGHILVEGKRLQAVSEVGYLQKGTKIVVIGGEGAHLTVRKQKTTE